MLADVFTKTGANFYPLTQILVSGKLSHTELENLMSQSCGEDKLILAIIIFCM